MKEEGLVMTKKAKKIISLSLALLLALSLLAGCGSGGNGPATSGTSVETAGTTAAVTTEGNKIKWSGTITVAPYMFGPVDENNNSIKPLLEEGLLKYGYDVDLVNVYIENSDYENLLNVRIAANDAPDVFEPKSPAALREYYRQGSIASWDRAFYEENCPTINSFISNGGVDGRLKNYVDMFWDFAMIDGKMVTIPKFDEAGTMLPKVMLLRGDWLENLGVEELPYTLDDFLALMYRFRNDDPDKNGKKDTYGFSTSAIRAIFGAFYGYTGFPDPKAEGSIYFYDINGKIECGDVMATNKEALAVLSKCYADGIIDPEFVAQLGENTGGYWALSQPFINGRIGASCHAGIDHYRLPEVTGVEGPCAKEYFAVNGNYNFKYAPWPKGPQGNYGGWSLGPACSIGENAAYNAALNKDTEKLAAILQIMDIFAKDDELAILGIAGVEGTHFEYTGDSATPSLKSLMDNEKNNAAGVGAYRGIYGGPAPYNEKYMRMSYYNSPTIANMLKIQAQEGYKGGYNRDVYDSTASTTKYKEELITYRDETFIKIIRGELSLDAYDTYVQEYMKRGGEILTKEAQEWYDAKK